MNNIMSTNTLHRRTTTRTALLVLAAAVCAVASLIVPMAAPTSAASPKKHLGINVLLYPQYGTKKANFDAAKKLFAYLKSLNANSVALCIQMYPDLSTSQVAATASGVVAGSATPSPSYLAQFVDLAHGAGLMVQVRPLLNEDLLHAAGTWRGEIKPTNPTAWFSSYTTFLTPYLTMSQQHHVESFAIGAELTSMTPYNRYWLPLVSKAKKLSRSEIIFESNWVGRGSLPGATYGYDNYQPISGIATAADATVDAFTTKMKYNLLKGVGYGGLPVAPSEAEFSEIAIAALDQSWLSPWVDGYDPTKNTINRTIQANWFTASCNAFHDLGMRGIYFWAIIFNFNFNPAASADSSDPTKAKAYEWQNTASADAIRTCFARG